MTTLQWVLAVPGLLIGGHPDRVSGRVVEESSPLMPELDELERLTPVQIIDRYVVDLFDSEEIDVALREHGYPEGIAALREEA